MKCVLTQRNANAQESAMTETPPPAAEDRQGISLRAMDIAVACLFLLVGVIVVWDSYRLGSKWGSDGPESGYFPFYIGTLMCIASLATLLQRTLAFPSP